MKYKDFFSEITTGKAPKLVGGVGDATAPEDVNPAELASGVTVEAEHTTDPDIATEIALDHLTDVPDYYTRLRKAGLAKELDACNNASGLGDPDHPINDKPRLGTTITSTAGNNVVKMGKTPNGSIDGRRGVPPIINRDATVDVDIIDVVPMSERKIKLGDIAKQILNEGGKLFGSFASRVTTDEMYSVFDELKKKLVKKFQRFNLSTGLASKKDHGDVDIIVLPKSGQSARSTILSGIQNNIAKNERGQIFINSNGNIFSVLYKPDKLDKQVHVDFISAESEEDFETKENFLAYNDFSGIVGVMARKLNFRYGSEGFFKIFIDKNGQNRYILITKNLKAGLKILGFRKVNTNFANIKSEDDIVKFVQTSPLFDVRQFTENLNSGDLKKMRPTRKTAQYIKAELIKNNQHRSLADEDYFLKHFYPKKYAEVERTKVEVNKEAIKTSKYGGEWLLKNFKLTPGPVIGQIKSFLNSKYGDGLDNAPEDAVKADVQSFLSIQEKIKKLGGILSEINIEGGSMVHEIGVFYRDATEEEQIQMDEFLKTNNIDCIRVLIKKVTKMSTDKIFGSPDPTQCSYLIPDVGSDRGNLQ